jgi:bifunctional non-homologous end joining protein LigD
MDAEKATSVRDAARGHDAVLEVKLDGWRFLAVRDDDGVRMFVRSGNQYKVPVVEATLADLLPPGSILDGELVSPHGGAWRVRSDLAAGGTDLVYVTFDLLQHRGIDARPTPLRFRRELLERIVPPGAESVMVIPQYPATDAQHARLIDAGFEGSMVKWLDEPYHSGHRGRGWEKVKYHDSEDAVVIGHEPGKEYGALVFAHEGETAEWGTCKLHEPYDPAWLGRTVEVRHFGVLPSGSLRHPQLLRFRPDKDRGRSSNGTL